MEVAPEIDLLLEEFYRETVGPFWDFERRLVENGYRTITFPFEELHAPKFHMNARWSLHHLLGYVRTWSATRAFMAARGFDPVINLGEAIAPLWNPNADKRNVYWPLSVRIGRSEL